MAVELASPRRRAVDACEEIEMKTVVVYESMYGNTHQVAERIKDAAAAMGEVSCVPVAGATVEVMAGADVVFVGGPTHAHGMVSEMTRKGAVADAPKHHLDLDPDAEGEILRGWFKEMGKMRGTKAVAFDTRFDGPLLLTGQASKGIDKRLRHHGFTVVAEPESFIVDRKNHLVAGEADRAQRWAEQLLAEM
jgi:flavodoxin